MTTNGASPPAFSTHAVSAISLSASGTYLAAACVAGPGTLVVTSLPQLPSLSTPCTALQTLPTTLRVAAPSLSALAFESDSRIYTVDSRGALILYSLSDTLQKSHQVQAAHSGAALTGVAAAPGLTATSGKDGLIKAWDAATGVCVARLKGHKGEARAVCIAASSDGQDNPVHLLASAGRDKTVRLWDVRAGGGQAVHVFAGHAGWVHDVGMCGGSTPRILSCGGDKTVRVWNLATMREEAVLSGHEYRVWAVAAAPGGEFAVSGSTDTNVRFWPLGGEAPKEEDGGVWDGHEDSVLSVAVARDASFAVSAAENGSVLLWDVAKMRASDAADVAPTGAPVEAYAGMRDVGNGARAAETRAGDSPSSPVRVKAPVEAYVGMQEVANGRAVETRAGASPPRSVAVQAEPSSSPATPKKDMEVVQLLEIPEKVETARQVGSPRRRVVHSPSVSVGRIRFLEEQVALRDADVAQRDATISERDLKIVGLENVVKEKEKEIRLLKTQLASAENLAKEANVRALFHEGSAKEMNDSLNYAEPLERISRVTGQLKALASRLDDMIVS